MYFRSATYSGREEAMNAVAPLIRYRCANPAHQRPTKSISDTMTIHEHSWAYCPLDVHSADHVWSIANPDAPILDLRERADPQVRG